MGIRCEKSQIVDNSIEPRSPNNTKMNGQSSIKSGPVQIHGSAQTVDGTSAKEVKISLVQVYSAMTKPAVRRKNNGMSFAIKTKLYIKSLVLSRLLI